MRYLLLALIPALSACQTMLNIGDVPKSLYQRTEQFEAVVRWGALQKMYVFVKRAPDEVVEIQEGLDNIRVTGYELGSGLAMVEPTRWRQTAVIDYVLVDRQIVRQVIDDQTWVSEDEGKTWYRENPPPQFQ
jgi:hypothetical protein